MTRGLLDQAEERRHTSLASLAPQAQAARGQYFTPHLAARIIAGLPRIPETDAIRILDPGAGVGPCRLPWLTDCERSAPVFPSMSWL